MKKYICLLAAILLLTVGASAENTSVTVSEDGYDVVIYEENFDGCVEVEDSSYTLSNVTASLVSETDGNYLEYSLTDSAKRGYAANGNAGNMTNTQISASPFLYAKIEMDIMLNSRVNGAQIAVYNSSTSTRSALLNFNSNGKIVAAGGEVAVDYAPEEWVSAVIYLNHADKTFTAYAKNTLLGENLPIPNSQNMSMFTQIRCLLNADQESGFPSDCKMSLDNIKYSVPDVSSYEKEIFADDFESYTKDTNVVNIGTSWSDKYVQEAGNTRFIRSASDGNLPDAELHGNVFERGTKTTNNNYWRLAIYKDDTLSGPIPQEDEDYASFKHISFGYDFLATDYYERALNIVTNNGNISNQKIASLTADGYVEVSSNKVKYELNTWNKITFDVNFETGKYDVYLNNKLVEKNVTIPQAVTRVQSFGISESKSSDADNEHTMYVDNVFYKIPSEKEITVAKQSESSKTVFVSFVPGAVINGGTLLVAGYNGDSLAGVETAQLTATESAYDMSSAVVSVNMPDAVTYKAFFWNSMNNLVPLTTHSDIAD